MANAKLLTTREYYKRLPSDTNIYQVKRHLLRDYTEKEELVYQDVISGRSEILSPEEMETVLYFHDTGQALVIKPHSEETFLRRTMVPDKEICGNNVLIYSGQFYE